MQNPPLKLSSVFCLRSDDKSLENRLEKKPQKVELFSRSATLCLANCPTVRPRGLGPSLHCCSLHIGHTDKYGSNRANVTQIQYNLKKENMEECGQKYLHLLADPGDARGCSTNTIVIKWFFNWLIKSSSSSLDFTTPPSPNSASHN